MGAANIHGPVPTTACCCKAKEADETQDKGEWAYAGPGIIEAMKVIPESKRVEKVERSFSKGRGQRSRRNSRRSSRSDPKDGKRNEDVRLISDVLRLNSNLHAAATLEEEHISQLVQGAWQQSLAEGEVLMSEGHLSIQVFYIIASGFLEVQSTSAFDIVYKGGVAYLLPLENAMPQVTARKVGPRTCLGEISMLSGGPRLVSARARTRATVWCIDGAAFKEVQQQAIAKASEEGGAKPQSAPSLSTTDLPNGVQFLAQVLSANINIQLAAPFRADHRRMLVEMARTEVLDAGQILTVEGDSQADAFYIVKSGSFELSSSQPFEVIHDGLSFQVSFVDDQLDEKPEKTTRIVAKGAIFGVASMLFGTPRALTAIALETSEVCCIDLLYFREVQALATDENILSRVQHLDKMEELTTVSKEDKHAIAMAMESVWFEQGDEVLQQGVAGDNFYIMTDGSVDVNIDGTTVTTLTANSQKGVVQYFGEKALLNNKPRAATVVVTSKFASGFVLEKKDFEMLADVMRNHAAAKLGRGASTGFAQRLSMLSEAPCCLKAPAEEFKCKRFERVGVLGHTSFGVVDHLKVGRSKTTYALKRFYKGNVVKEKVQHHVLRERTVWQKLSNIRSNFVLECFGFFNEADSLSILLEAAVGGPLSFVYPHMSFYGSLEHTRYYIACALRGLDHLHENHRVVYRNLKPENILLNEHGLAKLGNMSMAKVVVGKTNTSCGTPDYMAPEVVVGGAYSKSVDWYAIGILAFELMAGTAPFEGETPREVYSKILRGISKAKFPEACSTPSVCNFIKSCAAFEPAERLAMRPSGVRNVMKHQFFEGFDWEAHRGQKMKAPFVPAFSFLPHLAKEGEPVKRIKYKNNASGWDDVWS